MLFNLDNKKNPIKKLKCFTYKYLQEFELYLPYNHKPFTQKSYTFLDICAKLSEAPTSMQFPMKVARRIDQYARLGNINVAF